MSDPDEQVEAQEEVVAAASEELEDLKPSDEDSGDVDGGRRATYM